MPKLIFIARASDGMMLCELYEDLQRENFELRVYAKKIIKKIGRGPELCILETSFNSNFYYKISDGIIFLTCINSNYSQKHAFQFLDDIIAGFLQEVKKHFGSGESVDIRSKIETIERPYYFLKFDRFLRKTREIYLNPSTVSSYESVNVPKQNFQSFLDLDSTLREIEGKARHDILDSKLNRMNATLPMMLAGLISMIIIVLLIFIKFT